VRRKPRQDPASDLLAIWAAILVETLLLESWHIGRVRANPVEGLVGYRLEKITSYRGEIVNLVQQAVESGKVGGPGADICGPRVPRLASRPEGGDSGARAELQEVLTGGRRERREEPAGALEIAEYTMSADRIGSCGAGVRSEVMYRESVG
jgi:hypothetical protein